MIRRVLLAVLFSLPVTAHAQTIIATLNLDALGWGKLDTPKAIDIDGNTTTQEWLIYSSTLKRYRVVVEREGQTCPGPWFFPGPFSPGVAVKAEVQRIGGVDALVANHGIAVHVIRLDAPACPIDRPQ